MKCRAGVSVLAPALFCLPVASPGQVEPPAPAGAARRAVMHSISSHAMLDYAKEPVAGD
jgi:hypothetical protein